MVPFPDRPLSLDPIPFVRGLGQLISETRLAAILSQTGRASVRHRRLPAESVIWLVIAMALFAADSIPKVWRRLHPGRDASPNQTTRPSPRLASDSASPRSANFSSKPPDPWPLTRPRAPSTAAGG
jgi:Insertion element 4 transposase N-terminal